MKKNILSCYKKIIIVFSLLCFFSIIICNFDEFLGLNCVSKVSASEVNDRIKLYPGGQPIGIRISTKGVLVVALSDIEGNQGKMLSPAGDSDIEIGDSILKINGKEVLKAEDVSKYVNDSDGKKLEVTLSRKGTIIFKSVTPIKSKNDSSYKIGLWIRDSTAGIGTLTFYDEKSKAFAALGHPITDVDTNTILEIGNGQLLSSDIASVKKGCKGNPGELRGIFTNEDNPIGEIFKNTSCGIFGKAKTSLTNSIYQKPIFPAFKNEIKVGPAQILTTVYGEEPKLYDIEIQKLYDQDSPDSKSMLIKVTDKELLDKTGGIVQGMSGSPIIQNERLIGAVTHVLVNKPDTGYGVYIEWMLKDSDLLSK